MIHYQMDGKRLSNSTNYHIVTILFPIKNNHTGLN